MAKKRSGRAAKRPVKAAPKGAKKGAKRPPRKATKKATKKAPKKSAAKRPARKAPVERRPAKQAPPKKAVTPQAAPKQAAAKKAAAPRAVALPRAEPPPPITPPPTPPIAVDVAEQEALRAKFELGPHEWTRLLDSREKTQTIPWGYGRDRVTAMAVDPERLFLYWEVTDEAIAAARARLAGEPGTLVLRIHDITGLLFDGTNAHHSFDLAVGRADRQWFQHIGRPTSQVIVELGLAGHEGRFAAIARSHRVEFPRRDPAPPGPLEWLTVRELPQAPRDARLAVAPAPPPLGTPGSARESGGSPANGGSGGSASRDAGASGAAGSSDQDDEPSGAAAGERVESLAWSEVVEESLEAPLDQESGEWLEADGRSLDLARELAAGEWEMDGPSDAVVITQGGGPAQVERRGRSLRVREAPWSIEIRGIAARGGRRLLARWELRRVRVVSGGRQRFGERRGWVRVAAVGADGAAASEPRLAAGASERRWLAASELRLAGASEERFAGASERRRRGVAGRESEGGSEARLAGAAAPPALPSLPATLPPGSA
ncbi:MAG: DUF4912 domain-containing protein [Planctomycetes bacterium]|nr:DUF4912 domain-containing protein [Planctomycetota bacterium]